MKTARFAELVKSAGTPETHLLLVEPAKDKILQRAIEARRVVTVFQSTVGNKTDHGEVGFEMGPSRQYLIFPKAVEAYRGRRIVGIDYELFEEGSAPKAAPKGRPKKKTKSPTSRAAAGKVVYFPRSLLKEKDVEEDDEAVEALKDQVRHAMAELEKGRQVAAFNLLKRIVGD